jgi:predicted ATPase/transcriptional regulator with XRE-family HTH domain
VSVELGGGGFAAMLRTRRQALGMTQDQLARAAQVGVRTVRDLETGRAVRPQRSTVRLLATALGLTGGEREEFIATSRTGAAEPGLPQPGSVSNLPPAPELIGRDDDRRDIGGLLQIAGLVTLVGLAGVGKTGLALGVAHTFAGNFPGGVGGTWITDIATEEDILAAAAGSFGLAGAGELPARCTAKRRCLLVIDGADRSGPATAAAVAWLRRNVPDLRILVTSRHPLAIAGEHQWPISPLELPPASAADPATVFASPAVELFLNRLRRVRPAPVTDAEVPTLAALVRGLGGLPFAIELAAARGRVLDFAEMLSRYGSHLLDLGDPSGHTLRESVAASVALLTPDERVCLQWLALFRGHWSLELAEQLLHAGPGGVHRGGDVVALVDRLAAIGLVNVRPPGADLRFWLLDGVRDFMLEQSAANAQLAEAQHAHAVVMSDVVAGVWPLLGTDSRPAGLRRLGQLAMDIRGALMYALDADPVLALQLAAYLPAWWRLRDLSREGCDLLRRLLADPRASAADPLVRAFAQLGVGQLAAETGDGHSELAGVKAALETFLAYEEDAGAAAARLLLAAPN